MTRKDSSLIQFRERIPRDVLAHVRGRVLDIPVAESTVRVRVTAKAEAIKVSLRTRDPGEAKARHAVVSTHLANVYRSLRTTTPLKLTQAQCVALSEDCYRAWTATPLADQLRGLAPDGEDWTELGLDVAEAEPRSTVQRIAESQQRDLHRLIQAGRAHEAVAPFVNRALLSRGLRVDAPSRDAVTAEFVRSMTDAWAMQAKRARGDFSPDTNAKRFPPQSVLKKANRKNGAEQPTATDLFNRWRQHPDQASVTPSTLASYSAVFDRFKAFLTKRHGAEPAVSGLTRADIRAYIDKRSENGVKPKTINAVDLGAINAVFNWAVEQEILTSGNPAARIKRKARKDAEGSGRKTLNDAEATAILAKALHYVPAPRESPKLAAAKRWVPWLMAYTGTRVGEMAQLRKSDVVKFDGHWAIAVSKEAGTVKTKSAWHIPLHPHLIEQGFLDFVEAAPDGHLFLTPRPDLYRPDAPPSRTKDPRGILGPLQSVKNKLAAFAKEALPASNGSGPAPNHGWRHRFKAQARKNGIDKEVRDAFADHASGDVAGDYGKDELFSAMVAALDKVPCYECG